MGLLWQCWSDGLDILIDCPCKFESKWLEKLDISGETKTQRVPPNNNFPQGYHLVNSHSYGKSTCLILFNGYIIQCKSANYFYGNFQYIDMLNYQSK